MGYAATLLDVQCEPDSDNSAAFTLLADNLPAVWQALQSAEQVLGDHISWCQSLDEYTGSLPERIAQVLHSYGWDDTAETDGNVRLGWWGGDKLGSCWNQITQAIAQGIDPALRVTWYLYGEDSELWCEILEGGTVRSYGVILSPADAADRDDPS